MLASESYPEGFSTLKPTHYLDYSPQSATLSPTAMASMVVSTLQALPLDLKGLFRSNIVRTWMEVVQHYIRRDLTKSRDKLPAISAVARKAHDIQKCRYLAGLWENNLVYELAYMVENGIVPCETSDEGRETQVDGFIYPPTSYSSEILYRAPSWSWASVDGPVTYPYKNDDISSGNNHALFQYIDHEINLRNPEDDYGQVEDGYLTVKAQTIMVTLTEKPFDGPQSIFRTTQVAVDGHVISTPGDVCRDEVFEKFEPGGPEVLAMSLLFLSHPRVDYSLLVF
jgi:hypothetical protein